MCESPRWQLMLFGLVTLIFVSLIAINQSINQSGTFFTFPLYQYHASYSPSVNSLIVPSINQIHKTAQMITTLRLCEPVEHQKVNQSFGDEWWPKIAIPTPQSINQPVNQSKVYWKFYDLSINQQGEVLFPLARGFQLDDGTWRVDWFNDDDTAWIRDLSLNQLINCEIIYSDQSIDQSILTIAAREGGSDPRPWAICSFNVFKIPHSIQITLFDSRQSINQPINRSTNQSTNQSINQSYYSQSVLLPICSFSTPLYHSVAMTSALYSMPIDILIDWITYHYLLGIDHFYIHYRYELSASDLVRISPLIDSGLLTMFRWPIQHNLAGRASLYGDQMMLYNLFAIRIAHHSHWVMVVDLDEYLKINQPIKSRECSNSLHCDSMIKQWLASKTQYSMVSFYTINVVAIKPPTNMITAQDEYRYPNQSINQSINQSLHLPLAVQRVWRRSFMKLSVSAHNKYFYQPSTILLLGIHGGNGNRGGWGDQTRELACAFHYHDYPVWFERGAKNDGLSEEEMKERIDQFWTSEAVRDTYASDVYEQLTWPKDLNQTMLEIVKPYGLHKQH